MSCCTYRYDIIEQFTPASQVYDDIIPGTAWHGIFYHFYCCIYSQLADGIYQEDLRRISWEGVSKSNVYITM